MDLGISRMMWGKATKSGCQIVEIYSSHGAQHQAQRLLYESSQRLFVRIFLLFLYKVELGVPLDGVQNLFPVSSKSQVHLCV